ncbi:MAG: branched-chain amino acid ABC transporter permease [Arenicellales bacterium]|jgi:branched-chain amino acid transport system permease protein|nr:branched-chain amino acid ABC transporter permease [Arenicellales bacterium]
MIYREAGQFKTSYAADQAVFPINQDRWFIYGFLFVAVAVVPLVASEYMLHTVLIPFLILAVAAMGLNILLGYCGQISLGTAGFMAVGAFAAYKIAIAFPDLPILINFIIAGLIAAAIGTVFGLPSLRIKGFYLAVTTIGAHFLIEWVITHFGWFTNYSSSGVITAPAIAVLGIPIETPEARYVFTIAIVIVLAITMKNLVRSEIGRAWMAIRDMDVAAEVIGIHPLRTKLLAFAISSFYCGISGALFVFIYLGTVEPQGFDITRAFEVLFMVIIGGLGSVMGSFFGAAFIVMFPILITNVAGLFGSIVPAEVLSNLELIVFGSLIIFFLIVEPAGLARLWSIGKEKLRLWPFPY